MAKLQLCFIWDVLGRLSCGLFDGTLHIFIYNLYYVIYIYIYNLFILYICIYSVIYMFIYLLSGMVKQCST